MHLLSVAAWQEADSLAARARLLRSPVICLHIPGGRGEIGFG